MKYMLTNKYEVFFFKQVSVVRSQKVERGGLRKRDFLEDEICSLQNFSLFIANDKKPQ